LRPLKNILILLGKKEKIMGLLVDGDVKLFNHVTINEGASTSASGGTMTLYTAPTILYAIKKGDVFYEVKKKNFKEMITTLFSDCQSVVDKVVSKIYTLEDIETVVNEYNSCK
jgi:hypothetical protein